MTEKERTARTPPPADFGGCEVVTFESRNAREAESLITRHRGVPRVAPSVEEVPLEDQRAALEFGARLLAGNFDVVVFTTGVGVAMLFEALDERYERAAILGALGRTSIIARGSKTERALKSLGLDHIIPAPEPNTWHEVISVIDSMDRAPRQIAVQEYGVANQSLLDDLARGGAEVFRVPVYRWALPRDPGPLREALRAISRCEAQVVIFTNAVQVDHAWEMAFRMGIALAPALKQCVLCSIGPSCSEALRSRGVVPDLEPAHHKLGIVIYEAAKQASKILREKEEQKEWLRPVSVGAKSELGAEREAWHNSRFMRACRREPVDATPVWLMRQAGRYLKEYRELRARVPFLQLCKNPDLVAEITVSAAQGIGADAAILFADLLLIAEPMGFQIDYEQGAGPRLSPPLRNSADVGRLLPVAPKESMEYVFEAVRRTRASLPAGLPLIGFSGAPFTLASYLIEGGASRSFRYTKLLMFTDPGAWSALMDYLAHSLAEYINGQISAGVQAIQIFDSWVGCLSPSDYERFVLPHMRALFRYLTPGAPVIHFGTGTGLLLEVMREAGGDVIGIDHRIELDAAWRRLGSAVAIQGNLDPVALCANIKVIRERATSILRAAQGRAGHIFNLGHGVLPETPVENAASLIEIVHEESARFLDRR